MLYILAITLLLTHELDAVARSEWRILPILRAMPEPLAAHAFIVGHVPLFVILGWLATHPDLTVRHATELVISAFCVVHAGLHWLLRNHPANSFGNRTSQILIWSCASAGALNLAALQL
jgi:hypothetical protein